jgi:sugar lactone lactonase YvrE
MTWSPDGKTIVLGNRMDKVIWVDVEEQRIVRKEEDNVKEVRRPLHTLSQRELHCGSK